MPSSDLPRTVLPIPERPHAGLVTYDAKDPDTSFPPIQPLRPPAGAPPDRGSGGQGDHVGVGRSAESTCRARASV
jgi:hypothetical protein